MPDDTSASSELRDTNQTVAATFEKQPEFGMTVSFDRRMARSGRKS